MRRWVAWIVFGAMAGAMATSCNTIAGIDDIVGLECQTAADCPLAGECTATSCSDSRCTYGLAPGQACAGGECNDEGACVECITQEGCVGKPLPFCNVEAQRCVECGSDGDCAGGFCREGKCVECLQGAKNSCSDPDEFCSPIDNRCVECDTSANCSNVKLPAQQCWTLVCAVDRVCVPTPTDGEPCTTGEFQGTCQLNGACSPLPP